MSCHKFGLIPELSILTDLLSIALCRNPATKCSLKTQFVIVFVPTEWSGRVLKFGIWGGRDWFGLPCLLYWLLPGASSIGGCDESPQGIEAVKHTGGQGARQPSSRSKAHVGGLLQRL
eukprot:1458065-Amphidinium_carterae.1